MKNTSDTQFGTRYLIGRELCEGGLTYITGKGTYVDFNYSPNVEKAVQFSLNEVTAVLEDISKYGQLVIVHAPKSPLEQPIDGR